MTGPAEALRPLLAVNLARFRLLDVTCPQSHRLVQVIGTPSGRVVLYRPGGMQELDLGEKGPPVSHLLAGQLDGRRRRQPITGWLSMSGWFEAYCRCGESTVSGQWMLEQIGANRRRVVWDRGIA